MEPSKLRNISQSLDIGWSGSKQDISGIGSKGISVCVQGHIESADLHKRAGRWVASSTMLL